MENRAAMAATTETVATAKTPVTAQTKKTVRRSPRAVLFDWGDTLMSEDGPQDVSMAYWPEVRVIEGARETLAWLAATGRRVAVATNATVSKRADIAHALARAGLGEFVGEIFCRTELGCAKDDPRFWAQVCTRLGARPEELLMIGDSLEQDVRGPRASGVAAVWFAWKETEPRAHPRLPADAPVITRLAELRELIGD